MQDGSSRIWDILASFFCAAGRSGGVLCGRSPGGLVFSESPKTFCELTYTRWGQGVGLGAVNQEVCAFVLSVKTLPLILISLSMHATSRTSVHSSV